MGFHFRRSGVINSVEFYSFWFFFFTRSKFFVWNSHRDQLTTHMKHFSCVFLLFLWSFVIHFITHTNISIVYMHFCLWQCVGDARRPIASWSISSSGDWENAGGGGGKRQHVWLNHIRSCSFDQFISYSRDDKIFIIPIHSFTLSWSFWTVSPKHIGH